MSDFIESALMNVRPAQFAGALKVALGISRRVVRTDLGQYFWVDPVSVFGRELITSHIYERRLTSLFVGLLRPGDTFVDIGGNEGYFSILASSRIAHGSVHCIEPQTRLQAVIRRNIDLNGAQQIVLHQCALSNKSGQIQLNLRPSTNTGSSSIYRHWKIGSKTETVPTISLDELFAKEFLTNIRLMKVDAEGAEGLITEGGSAIWRCHAVEFIVMEYHPTICGQECCRACHQKLVATGYLLRMQNDLSIYHLPEGEQVLQALAGRAKS